MRFEGYMAGVNLGGWISQCNMKKEHFDSFITKKDMEQIVSWGMDHVRLPIDYMLLEEDEKPFVYKEEGFYYIDQCIEWCKELGLNLILDLHRAPGYAFHSLNENKLFENDHLQSRYIKLWQAFATRYKGHGQYLTFELLNEIVEPDSSRWNRLSQLAIDAIRAVDLTRTIILGGNFYNSVTTLKELDVLEDENLVYTFHFYLPHVFTHQRASWEEKMKELDFLVPYPSDESAYEQYSKLSDEFKKSYPLHKIENKETLREYLQPALLFLEERSVRLYCGEFGVIENVPMEYNLQWHEDFIGLLKEYEIGRSVWSYKLMNFPMVDKDSVVCNHKLIELISSK